MLAYTYIEHGKFELLEKPKPEIRDSRDAIVAVSVLVTFISNTVVYHVQYRE